MKVLFVVSANVESMPFVVEQKESLEKKGVKVDCFSIYEKGIKGYLKSLSSLKRGLKSEHYNVIHAHYGLAGLLAVLQRSVPVVITFHGSDVNFKRNRLFSFVASRLSGFNIFVNDAMPAQLLMTKKYKVLPCGVDMKTFFPLDKSATKVKLGFDEDIQYILFTSSFDNRVKNYPLAKAIVDRFHEKVKLLELKGKSRPAVNELLNASDLLLMTSFTEGSPQITKEALATNTPIVSTDVGDVRFQLKGVSHSFTCGFDEDELFQKVQMILNKRERSDGRGSMQGQDLDDVADIVISIYEKVIDKNVS